MKENSVPQQKMILPLLSEEGQISKLIENFAIVKVNVANLDIYEISILVH